MSGEPLRVVASKPGVLPLHRPSLDDGALGRALRLFHVYRFLCTSYLFVPVLMRFFHERGLDFTRITLLNSVYAGTALIFEIPTGALADRFGRTRAMLLGALLMALGCMVDFAGHDFWVFAVGEGLLALGMTLASGADSAYLYDLLRAAGRANEYAKWEGSATAAKMLGAAAALVAGGFVGAHALGLTYAVSAGVCTLAAIVAFLLREPPLPRDERPTLDAGFFRGMTHAARAVVVHRPLLFAVGFSLLVFTLLRMGLYLYPTWLEEAGFGARATGIALAVLSVVGAVGAQWIVAVRRRIGEARLVWLVPLVIAVSYVGLGHWFAWGGLAFLGVQSLANGVFAPFSKELLNREIKDSGERATVLSVDSMARRLAFGAFAPALGLAMDNHGSAVGFYLCGVTALAGAVALALWARARRRPPREGLRIVKDSEGAP